MKRQPSTQRIKIVVVEDHPIFRQGLVQMINDQKDLEVCAEAGNVAQGLEAIVKHNPMLAIVDITLPGENGQALIKKLRAMNHPVKILVVSMHDEAIYAARVLRAGGDGYIMKQEDPEEIIQALRDVLGGHIYVSEQVSTSMGKNTRKENAARQPVSLDLLTDRELEVLELLGRGKVNAAITKELQLPQGEITIHRKQIMKKLKIASAAELIRSAQSWVESGTM